MDRKVYKYEIYTGAVTVIPLPKGAIPLHFAMQNDLPFLWIETPRPRHDNHPQEDRKFQIFGTGHPLPEGAKFVGTILDGSFVWHLYEVFA